MRKIRLLLVAVVALMGMSAFAQLPTDQSIGYLYDAAAKKFINAEGKVGATGMPFKALKQGSSKDYTTKDGTNRKFTSYRFKTTDGSKGLGIDNTNGTTASTNGIVTSTGTYGYGVFAVVPIDEGGFRIMSTYNRADFNVDYLYDYCLGYKENGTLFCFPEAEAPIWQFVDEDAYKKIVADNVMPKQDQVGYLYNPATNQFITASATMDTKGVEFIIGERKECGDSFGSDDGTIHEAGYSYLRIKLNGTSNYMRMSNSGVICTGSGYHKWAAIGTENGLVIRCIYSSTQGGGALSPFAQQGYYLTPDADGKLALVETPTDASYWQYMSKEDYDALMASMEPEPEPVIEFPNDGAKGYLYNPATNMFINANGALDVKGALFAVYRKSTDNKDTDIRFGNPDDPANKHLRINGDTPTLQTNDPYYSKWGYEVADDGKFLLKAGYDYSYGCTKGYYLTANEDDGYEYVATATESSYWQFVDEETYKTLIIPQFTTDEIYFLKNVESGLFFAGENNWGTRGTVSDRGDEFKLVKLAEGAYAIQNTLVSVNDKNLGSNIYVDNAGAAGGWTFDQVAKGVYTIFHIDAGGYLAQGTEQLSKGFAAVGAKEVTDAAKWYLLTKDEAITQMAKATSEKPEPATFLIKNPGFNRNYSNAAWTMQANNKNLSGGTDNNRCAESWQSSFTLSQTINVPNGKYILTAQAALTDYTGAYDGKDYPVVYGNDVTAPFNNMDEGDRGTNMGTLSNAFAAGKYVVQLDTIYVVNGELTIGVKGTRTNTWCIWDNFTLAYYGPVDIATFKRLLEQAIAEAKATLNKEMYPAAKADLQAAIAEYDGAEYEGVKAYMDATDAVNAAIAAANASAANYANYRDALAAAKAILPETMPAGVLKALDQAIKTYPESSVLTADATEESINAAATALWDAYNAAKAAVDSSKALMGMYELMENNNVVTPEAYDIYMDKFEGYNKQWKAGTLKEAVVNPYALNGWHNTSLDYDDYLLSAWTIGGEQCVDFDTPLYINTWSTEGEGDGTNFKVPFFEYWTGDANSLGANELEATLADVEPGVYEVTAWVRVRAKNGTTAADATGITLQLNDGEVVDVTEGEAIGSFNLAEYKAEGTVEDGTLKVKFSVAGDNNISWLSFQNVKYEKTGDIATAISEVSGKAAAKSMFNVAGQQLSAPAKGLNIIDGKKVYVK